MAFGFRGEGLCEHEGVPVLDPGQCIEHWRADGELWTGIDDGLAWRQSGDMHFGVVRIASTEDPVGATLAAYRRMFEHVRDGDCPRLLRIWNYLPRINDGDDDAERYRRFCMGRAKAFDEAGDIAGGQWPAGTAVGPVHGDSLLVCFLSTSGTVTPVENPRQTHAYEYPREYGPRSPLFSRAAYCRYAGRNRLFASGTASIVGHRSVHEGNLDAQLEETWRNLQALCDAVGGAEAEALRVYLRQPADLEPARRFVSSRVPAGCQVLYLQADICRAELLVEIEGVYAINDAPGGGTGA